MLQQSSHRHKGAEHQQDLIQLKLRKPANPSTAKNKSIHKMIKKEQDIQFGALDELVNSSKCIEKLSVPDIIVVEPDLHL